MPRKRYKKKQNKIDIAVVVAIIGSILLAILIYTKSDSYIGTYLNPILGGIMGWIKYIVPIGVFLIGIYLVYDDKNSLISKLVQYAILLLCITTIMSTFQISNGTIDINSKIEVIIQKGYELGTQNIGGGAIGTIVAVLLIKLLSVPGTIILSIGIALIICIFMFDIRPSEILGNLVKNYVNKRQEKKSIRQENKKAKTKTNIDIPIDDQITINLNQKSSKLKKFMHGKNDIDLIQKEDIKPDVLEANLFKQEQEQKEEKIKEVLTLEHAITVEDEHYEFPPIQLLNLGVEKVVKGGKKAVAETATKLQKTLYSFGVSAKVENVSVGPAITRYELRPAEGVRVSKIANLSDDIALNLAASSIRIEAPIPGKQAVGIEIPNKENEVVCLRDIIDSDEFKDNNSKLSFALGKNVAGEVIVTDIAKMPHILIAGATGSGKSVCINTLITSIIYKSKPSEVKLVMIDPKVVELSVYNGIPHLLIPVVTDPKKAAGALSWAVQEMSNRYSLFASKGVRDIKGYNNLLDSSGEKLPQIVIIIDELADLMMVAPNDVEDAICRLAQMARAAGMYLVIATQRPSVDVITGIIKANIPSRISFAVSSQVDSRTILDMSGAEKLLGKGDMLFYPSGVPKPTRIQGAFISEKEIEKIVDFLKSNGEVKYSEDIIEKIEKANCTDKELKEGEDDDTDLLLNDAIETVIETGQASTSFIQRRFKVGYARAGRIIDQMEERGIISGYEGSKPRQVLMPKERWEELKMTSSQTQQE